MADQFSDASRQVLAKQVAEQFQVPQSEVAKILQDFSGLPSTLDIKRAVFDVLVRWLPALRHKYRYTRTNTQEMGEIPHTVRITDPYVEPDGGHWRMHIDLLDGPLCPRASTVRVSHRMACSMLIAAVGVRTACRLERPRPYDLHQLSVLTGVQDTLHGIRLIAIYTSADLKRMNSDLMKRRLALCEKGLYRCACWHCGRIEHECELARSTKPPTRGVCVWCKTPNKLLTPMQVCIDCLELMMTRGVLPPPPA